MGDWLRRAGRGRAADGAAVIWTVAEGSRGRRWREVVTVGSAIRSSLLLELDRERRFSHLELSTAAGLLTLHPEPDATLHGNAVTGRGVEHVEGLPWDRDAVVLLEGSPVCRAAAVRDRRRGVRATPALAIGLDLSLRMVTARIDGASWADGAGLPVLDAAHAWDLERRGEQLELREDESPGR